MYARLAPCSRRQRHVTIVNRHLMALADQHLHQCHDRALAQVVGPRLEAEAQHRNLPLAGPLDQPVRLVDVLGVAQEDRPENWPARDQFPRLVEQRTQVLGQTGSAEGKPGLQ